MTMPTICWGTLTHCALTQGSSGDSLLWGQFTVTPQTQPAEKHTSWETQTELPLPTAPWAHDACSHPRASVLPVPTIWSALPPESFMTQVSCYLIFFLVQNYLHQVFCWSNPCTTASMSPYLSLSTPPSATRFFPTPLFKNYLSLPSRMQARWR